MLRLIILLFTLMALSACGVQANQPRVQPAQIESVAVEIRESQPVQVVAIVKGGLSDGCTSLGAITQRRDGNTIEISVTAVHSGAEGCTAIYQLFEEQLDLAGEFTPGEYRLIVNGVEQTFTV